MTLLRPHIALIGPSFQASFDILGPVPAIRLHSRSRYFPFAVLLSGLLLGLVLDFRLHCAACKIQHKDLTAQCSLKSPSGGLRLCTQSGTSCHLNVQMGSGFGFMV